MEKTEVNKVEIYVHDGGQFNLALDHGQINAVVENDESNAVIQNRVEKFQNNKKRDYIDNWNSRLFLHQDNDENPITLADAFIMPDFQMHKSIKRIGFSEDDTLDKIIEKFAAYDKTSTMLITGVPGIGKSTITSWIANQYREDDTFIILRFRDWECEELENGLVKAICNTLKCRYSDLNNKILILDGFDELKSLDIREEVLNRFFSEILDWKNIKIIITSRPVYIASEYFQNVAELSTFDMEKIESFFKKITGYELAKKEKIESNLEVLGIPVILYMAIMCGVDISDNPTKPELYNRIFAQKGGIYDRFSMEGIGYDEGSQLLRNPKNVQEYLKFLGSTAFKMFEMHSQRLNTKDCEISELELGEKKVSVLEFPIKHFFEYADDDIEFIHKSIYEYFVAEYMVEEVYGVINQNGYDKKELASVFGKMFKSNVLSVEILEFLKFKVRNSTLNTKFDAVNESFQLMLQDGMTYHTNECYKNVMDCEMNVFANMLEILHLWDNHTLKLDKKCTIYIHHNRINKMNFRNADLLREDILKALKQLERASFDYLILLENKQIKQVYKEELFPEQFQGHISEGE